MSVLTVLQEGCSYCQTYISKLGRQQERINDPTTLSTYPPVFCLALLMAIPNRKSEGRGAWELPYIAASFQGKSRAEKNKAHI